jgi:putative phosphoribosyl transferase
MFINRQQTGLLLAGQLKDLIEQNIPFNKADWIVLALPRGGLPIGLEIAMMLGCDLDVFASKKIGAPDQPELAIGAVTSDGVVVVDERMKDYLDISQEYLDEEIEFLIKKTKEQESTLRRLVNIKSELELKGRDVILVDDGVATGLTAVAAAQSLRQRGARQLIFATPVASYQAYKTLCDEYDLVLSLEIPAEFKSVGQFYKDFSQVEDLEVIRALTLAGNRQKVGYKK